MEKGKLIFFEFKLCFKHRRDDSMDSVMEIKSEKAIVRIHPGKLTEEERRSVLETALVEFFQRIQKKGASE